MFRFAPLPWIIFLACAALLQAAPPQPTLSPLLRVVDLTLGESAEVQLCDGTKVQVKLLDLKETRDSIRNAVRVARVSVEVDGHQVWLTSGNYNLPITVGKAQIDCPITKGTTTNANGDHWGLEKDARLRLWPAGSSLFLPGKFVYPVKQRWFVSATQMANEPVHNNGEEDAKVRKIYYHYGLDFGGAEIVTPIVAATDGLVVSAGTTVLPGYADTPVAIRYDVIYLLDAQGWYYRYSHLHSFTEAVKAGAKVKAGQPLGLLGKEGGSGGWSHLHLDIFCRQPSGKWGCQEAYAFVWEAYQKQYHPKLIAVARPHNFLAAGETAVLDGRKSWSADSKIVRYQWTFCDGQTAEGPRVERKYDRPGYYSEVLKVTDAAGRSDYDFATVVVAERGHPERTPPGLHVAYYPSLAVHPGDTLTFKARMFGATQGEETWDFGDGSPPVATHSNRDPDRHAKDGYAVLTHRYQRPGDYLVRVERKDNNGWPAIGRVHVPVARAQLQAAAPGAKAAEPNSAQPAALPVPAKGSWYVSTNTTASNWSKTGLFYETPWEDHVDAKDNTTLELYVKALTPHTIEVFNAKKLAIGIVARPDATHPKPSCDLKLGDYVRLTDQNWTKVSIPLADFTGVNLHDIYFFPALPQALGTGDYSLGVDEIRFVGGSAPVVWYGDAHPNNPIAIHGPGMKARFVATGGVDADAAAAKK